ncbi:penicillin-binding protein [Sinorhizobium medicae]|nr:penicillin-binding protein [Sinorhizobium medicae]TWA37944.1 penicillin-binding protein [Sinorhizobium medicae]
MKRIGFIFSIISAAMLAAFGIGAVYLSDLTRGLPDHRKLAEWEPAVMTRFYAYDGTPLAEYARERRLFLPIAAIPERVKGAFLSAEDKSFYTHSGIDVLGVAKAAWSNAMNAGSGQRLIGASTITQQLAKNFLLSSDRTLERKIKEAVLSIRIEHALGKDRILELYLNDIYLGLGAYGIAAGALTYFDKSVSELTVAEAAYLAALPKGPNNYNPYRHAERAISRRDWVIAQMQRNGFVSAAEARDMMARPLGVKPRAAIPLMAEANYFAEEVRRQVAAEYGEAALYTAGLSVRTTLDPALQAAALKALRAGLVEYDQMRGFRGPLAHIDLTGDWAAALEKQETLADVKEWQLATVLSCSDEGVRIGLRNADPGSGRSSPGPVTGFIDSRSMRWALKLPPRAKLGRRAPFCRFSRQATSFMSRRRKVVFSCGRYRKCRVRSWRWTRIRGACWRALAASPSRSRGSIAPRRHPASPVQPSSRSFTRPLSIPATLRRRWSRMRPLRSRTGQAQYGDPRTTTENSAVRPLYARGWRKAAT